MIDRSPGREVPEADRRDRVRPTPADDSSKPLTANWAAYGLCVWALPFAILSMYWGLGGTWAADAVSPTAQQMVADRVWWFMLLLWLTVLLKLGYGIYALALMRPWGRRFPRWLLLLGGVGLGTVTVLYGAAQLALSVPVYVGAIDVPDAPEPEVLRWHVLLWQPYWCLGGLMVLSAVFIYGRRSRALSRGR